MADNKITPAGLGCSALFATVAGFLFASFYTTIQEGVRGKDLLTFNLFEYYYETPFYQSYVTPGFLQGLMIIAGCMVLAIGLYVASAFKKPSHHGTARWANFGEIARAGFLKRYSSITGPIFGRTTGPFWFGKYLTNGDHPHSLIVAPTRAGKGVGVVIPTLLTYKGSILALDVKGELFELTSRARKARGSRIFKFAPMDNEGRTHSYNPVLDVLNMPPERRFAEVRRLAVNLIVPKNKGAEGFIDGARDLFVAGIFACIERGTPTIGAVYDLFSQPGEKYKLFAQLAEECKSPEARRIFDNMASNDTKILTSYTSVLGDSGLNLWADPLIKAATTTSDINVHDLRRHAMTIYICVSPNDLEVISPLIRLFFQQVVSILQRTMPGKDEKNDVLFLLDEFKHLGKLEAIETAVTTIAGYRGRFMFIIQSLSALTGGYEESGKQNFLSNTGIQVFMATSDDETPTYISKAIGEQSFQSKSISRSSSRRFDVTTQVSEQGSALMRPEQIRLLDDDHQIVLIKGRPPMKMPKVKYYKDRNLKKLFEGQSGPLPEPAVLTPPMLDDEIQPTAPAMTGNARPEAGWPAAPADDNMGPQDGSGGDDMDDEEDGELAVRQQVYAAESRRAPEPEADPVNEAALEAQRQLLERIIHLQRGGGGRR